MASQLPLPADKTAKLMEPLQRTSDIAQARVKELAAMPLSLVKANLAVQYQRECGGYLDALNKSELRQQATAAHKLHAFLMEKLKVLASPVTALDGECRRVIGAWERHRRSQIETQRVSTEAADRKSQEDARIAEAEALEAQGRTEEAAQVLDTPIVPSAGLVDENQGKLDGTAMVEVWVPSADEKRNVLWESTEAKAAFAGWIAQNPAFVHLFEALYGPLKKLLTEHKGKLSIPGLMVEHKFEPRVGKGE